MSRRSLWGWGWADRFPDRQARRALGDQLKLVLGGGDFELRDPSEPRIPGGRLAAPPLAFASIDPLDRAAHAYGRSFRDQVRGFTGDFSAAPDVVFHPRTEEDIEQALAWAEQAGVAVVPFGGGTSVVGGVECRGEGFAGVASLDLRGLDRVLEVDDVSRAARIQAGATGPVLEAQLATHGLTLRHYPQSFEFSTLGGWIATRAGGHFATRYTHIDDLVESVRMITPAGPWESRRLPASGAGPSPDRLVLGSEGILGVITEAWVRLQARPRFRSKATLHFARFEDAAAAARAVAQSGLAPANCRVLDSREAMLNQVAFDGSSVLLLGFESAHHAQHALLDVAVHAARDCGGAVASGPTHTEQGERAEADEGGERWRQAFFEGPYLQGTLISLGVLVDTFETACTWSAFPALHDDVVRSVKQALGRPSLVSCRFTHVYPDGPAPYYTFVAPVGHDRQLGAWAEAKAAASEALMRNGATITHHHAVGRAHRPWYDQQRPGLFAAALRAARGALDPRGILNPGVLIGPT